MDRKSTRVEIKLSEEERERLERIAKDPKSMQKHVWRARIILELGSGCGVFETMRRTGKSKPTVWRWWDRFLEKGVDGLLRDATRPPGKAPTSEEKVNALFELAISPPPEHARHWTAQKLGKKLGMPTSTVSSLLRKKVLNNT